MEDGWVLIEQRDELDAVETSASSNRAPSPTTPSQFEHIYPSHLFISTQWLEIAAYSRGWMYIQRQECERYARHIAHFFPSDEVVERRRAAVADERRRAFEETQELVEIELKRQSDLAARHKREGESRNQWVAAILQRWAAADALKRREVQGGAGEGEAAGGVDGGAADGEHSKTETPVSATAAVKVGEPKDVVAEVEEEAKKEKKKEKEEDQQGEDKERKRLKEEGRKRFSEWKKKNESDGGGGGNVAAAAGVADGGAAPVPVSVSVPERRSLGQSAERELEEWELIEAQEGHAATANATTKAEAPPVQQEHEEEKEEEVEAVSENVAAADDEEERRLRDRTEAYLRERVKDKAGERSDVRLIPFAYPLRKVVAGFDHWRRSLWFAPAGFSQMIEGQAEEAVWMPYYTMRLTVISSFKAKIVVPVVEATTDASGKAKKTEVKEIVVSKESVYDNLLVCASVDEVDQSLAKSIEDYDVASALDVFAPSSSAATSSAATLVANAAQGDGGEAETPCGVNVRSMIAPNDAWKKAEKEIIAREKEACSAQIKREHSPQKIQQLILTKLTFKGRPSFSSLYAPVYLITYLHKGKRYAYAANGQTGRGNGERPYGVGNVIGGGIGLLENIFGVNEQETAGILSGQALKKVDNSPHYKDAGWYLVFPPSHSYLVTSATGFVTLRNAGTQDIVLSSQPRGGEKVIATHVLKCGETETFDYKGNWCVELRCAADGDRSQPDIELVEFQTSGGGHYGNKLGMTYYGL